jgi:hypothetical protein
MKKKIPVLIWVGSFLLLVMTWAQPNSAAAGPGTFAGQGPPPNLKVAFIGDQGLGEEPQAVLRLIKSEKAGLVIHSGDFDYDDDPEAWDGQINGILGPDFPYVASIGNHDVKGWSGPKGYQSILQQRCKRLGIEWEGDLGVKSSILYKGLHILLLAPGTMGTGHADYIKSQFEKDKAVWRICSWHKDMHLMQLGDKKDETGWEVYEAAREAGAIIATGHEHSYARTHLLSSFSHQTVANSSATFTLGPGRSFAFVSGIGGRSVRPQKQSGDWWAKVYTKTQNAVPGCLFAVFNVDGKPNKARFYFKNIKGRIIDRFTVFSSL